MSEIFTLSFMNMWELFLSWVSPMWGVFYAEFHQYGRNNLCWVSQYVRILFLCRVLPICEIYFRLSLWEIGLLKQRVTTKCLVTANKMLGFHKQNAWFPWKQCVDRQVYQLCQVMTRMKMWTLKLSLSTELQTPFSNIFPNLPLHASWLIPNSFRQSSS